MKIHFSLVTICRYIPLQFNFKIRKTKRGRRKKARSQNKALTPTSGYTLLYSGKRLYHLNMLRNLGGVKRRKFRGIKRTAATHKGWEEKKTKPRRVSGRSRPRIYEEVLTDIKPINTFMNVTEDMIQRLYSVLAWLGKFMGYKGKLLDKKGDFLMTVFENVSFFLEW